MTVTAAGRELTRHITLRPPTFDDALAISGDMRVEDAAELLRATGMTPLEGLDFCIKNSTSTHALIINSDVIGAFGVVPWSLATGRGSPWALTTNAVYRHRRAVARLSKPLLESLHRQCPNGLEVMVDAEYTTAVRWLRWLGFVVDGPHPWGSFGAPFMRAAIGRYE